MRNRRSWIFSLLFLAASAAAGLGQTNLATVQWIFSDFTTAAEATNRITIIPLAPFGTNGNFIIAGDRRTYTASATGSLIVSNLVTPGAYQVTLSGPYVQTTITNLFPATNGFLNAANYVAPYVGNVSYGVFTGAYSGSGAAITNLNGSNVLGYVPFAQEATLADSLNLNWLNAWSTAGSANFVGQHSGNGYNLTNLSISSPATSFKISNSSTSKKMLLDPVANLTIDGTYTGNALGLTNHWQLGPPTNVWLIADGDSITASFIHSYEWLLTNMYPWNAMSITSFAHSGDGLTALTNKWATNVAPYIATAPAGTKLVYSVWIGANDYTYYPALQWLTNWNVFLQQVKSSNCQVVAFTVLPRLDQSGLGNSQLANRAAMNAGILRSTNWDWLIDAASILPNNLDTNNNGNYYGAGTY